MPWGLAAAAAATVIGGVVSSKMSSDSAKDQQKTALANTFDKSGLYDASRYNYGGSPNGAADAAYGYTAAGNAAQSRAAPTTDYSVANGYGTMGNQDASSVRGLAGQLSNVAIGGAPTVAQQQAALQSQQLVQQQSSQAASARGAAGLALAGQQAETNTANGQASISQQAQVNAAQERLNDASAAAGMYGNLRSGDLASQQQNAAQAQYVSGLALQQRQANDQYQQQMTQNAIGVQNSQLQANIQQQNVMAGSQNSAANQTYQIGAQNAANQRAAVGGAVQGVANAATAIGTKAEGGPINAGQPYLVGEKGPELVVPQQSGLVIPAGPTSQMTGDASGLMAAAQDPQKAQILKAAQQNPQMGLMLRQQAMNNPAVAAKIQADPALMAIAMGKV